MQRVASKGDVKTRATFPRALLGREREGELGEVLERGAAASPGFGSGCRWSGVGRPVSRVVVCFGSRWGGVLVGVSTWRPPSFYICATVASVAGRRVAELGRSAFLHALLDSSVKNG